MSDAHAPPRWLDGADAELPPELLEGLRGCAQDGPSSMQRLRMQESLLRGVASAAPAAGSALLKLGLLSVVAGLALGGLWWWSRTPEASSPPVRSARPAGPAQSLPEPAREEPRQPPLVAPEAAGADATAAPASVPSTRPKAGSRGAPRADVAGELELLKRARRALGSAPERSLELVAEHAQLYGEGSFAQERELLAVEALVKLQQADEALRRAARFRSRYPGSAHLPRLDVLVGPP